MTPLEIDILFQRDGRVQICATKFYRPRSQTERAYLQEARRFQRWFTRAYGTPPKADEISTAFLMRYEQWLTVRFAPATIRRKRSAIRWFGGLLAILKLVPMDPFAVR